jgi:hypothetical protein
MTRPEPPLGSPEQTLEAVAESNSKPTGLEKDEKAAAAVKASNDAQFEAEKEGKEP